MKVLAGGKAVTLDVGGTLVEPWPSVGAVYAVAAARAGFGDFDPAVLERRFGEAWRARGFFDYSREAWAGLVEATFRDLTPRADDPRLLAALYQAFAQPGAWRIFPDVPPALAGLRAAGVRLGIISNWDHRLG
ncbi:MAG: HAD family hydrolase, partial [Verrucomicrobiota bacterium]